MRNLPTDATVLCLKTLVPLKLLYFPPGANQGKTFDLRFYLFLSSFSPCRKRNQQTAEWYKQHVRRWVILVNRKITPIMVEVQPVDGGYDIFLPLSGEHTAARAGSASGCSG
ncbi:MAG: hypothetical protein CSA33_08660 [Desulfobulbus propionicus]|nr:MAG: hypothetical protein CSA33_08660 [Desulfobulbus propionicus]